MDEIYQEINKVRTKEDFLRFLNLFIKDLSNNKQLWENDNLEDYLEGMESWIENMDGYYQNMALPIPKNIDWNVFANILFAAKMYE
jgi:hypothetical protein